MSRRQYRIRPRMRKARMTRRRPRSFASIPPSGHTLRSSVGVFKRRGRRPRSFASIPTSGHTLRSSVGVFKRRGRHRVPAVGGTLDTVSTKIIANSDKGSYYSNTGLHIFLSGTRKLSEKVKLENLGLVSGNNCVIEIDSNAGQEQRNKLQHQLLQLMLQQPEVKEGPRVKIVGLVSRRELNGLYGFVSNFNPVTGRYDIKLDDGNTIAVKPENIEAGTDRVVQVQLKHIFKLSSNLPISKLPIVPKTECTLVVDKKYGAELNVPVIHVDEWVVHTIKFFDGHTIFHHSGYESHCNLMVNNDEPVLGEKSIFIGYDGKIKIESPKPKPTLDGQIESLESKLKQLFKILNLDDEFTKLMIANAKYPPEYLACMPLPSDLLVDKKRKEQLTHTYDKNYNESYTFSISLIKPFEAQEEPQ